MTSYGDYDLLLLCPFPCHEQNPDHKTFSSPQGKSFGSLDSGKHMASSFFVSKELRDRCPFLICRSGDDYDRDDDGGDVHFNSSSCETVGREWYSIP